MSNGTRHALMQPLSSSGQTQRPDSDSQQQPPMSHPTSDSPTFTSNSTTTTSSSPSLPSPATPVLNLYLAAGAVLLTAGVAFGIRLGNRQAAQIEQDNPPPKATSKLHKPPPPITPQQRAAAFRATLGALGLGTALCGGFGVCLVWGLGRYWGVKDTKEFAVRMDGVVSEQRMKWLGSMGSSLPGWVAGWRESVGGTQLGGWIRGKGAVAGSEQRGSGSVSDGELSPQESQEVEQAVDFLKQLEADYQRTVANMGKKQQAQQESAEIAKLRKS